MSKGLSRQQRRLLGLAVAVSWLRYGTPRAHVAVTHRDWPFPVVIGVQPDLDAALAAHVLGRCGMRPQPSSISPVKFILETTPAVLSARSSLSRAMSSLERRGLLVYKPYGPIQEYGPGAGRVLTQTGLDHGLPYELVVPDLARLVWLTDNGFLWFGNGRWEFARHPEWEVREFLPSP